MPTAEEITARIVANRIRKKRQGQPAPVAETASETPKDSFLRRVAGSAKREAPVVGLGILKSIGVGLEGRPAPTGYEAVQAGESFVKRYLPFSEALDPAASIRLGRHVAGMVEETPIQTGLDVLMGLSPALKGLRGRPVSAKPATIFEKPLPTDVTPTVADVIGLEKPVAATKIKATHKPKASPEAEAGIKAIDDMIDDLMAQKDRTSVLKHPPLDKQIRELGAQKKALMGGEAGMALNPFNEIANRTSEIIERAKTPPELRAGIDEALNSMVEHDRNIRGAEFTSKKFEKTINDIVPDPSRQMLMVHAYENKLRGSAWDQLNPLEKKITEWAAGEKEKLNRFIKENDILETMPESPNINHIFHQWINPRTGKPFEAMYGKFSKGLPQAKQRTIPTYEAGIEAGLKPATTNIGKLIGLEWESVMRAHSARQLFKTLNNVKAMPDVKITRVGGKEPHQIRMIESWKTLADNGVTEDYVRYSSPFLDKKITFRTPDKRLVTLQGAVGVRKELFPFVRAYIENPNYGNLMQMNFVAKNMKLGLSMFHPISLAAQEVANFRVPFVNIPRGLKLRRQLGSDMEILYKEGLDLFKGYEDVGYRNQFFTGEGFPSRIGNVLTKPVALVRDFIFDVVQPGMKISFAYDKYNKMLPKILAEGGTKEQAARTAVRMADGHFSGEHWKRSLSETNRWMADVYFSPRARRGWQALLLSPTWQREHLLVAKNVAKSFMPDRLTTKMGLQPMFGIEKLQYRKYALGAVLMVGAVDLYNLMATESMDGEAKHIWQNPEGKGFAVRALWNEPDGSRSYFRPLKSIYEVAEWVGDPVQKFEYKLSPAIAAIGQQLWPTRYQPEYKGIADVPRRTLDLVTELVTPISASQAIQVARGKKALPSAILPFFGMPTSKEKIRRKFVGQLRGVG